MSNDAHRSSVSAQSPSSFSSAPPSTVRPIGLYAISGLTVLDRRLIALESVRGYLAQVDPQTNNTTILNGLHAAQWVGASGLAVEDDAIWFAKERSVFKCDRASNTFSTYPNPLQLSVPIEFAQLPYPANGVAVADDKVYVSCEKSGYIHVFDKASGKLVNKIAQPGIGMENLTIEEGALWVCDRAEQTVFCLDLATGKVRFSALTPLDRRLASRFILKKTTKEWQVCLLYFLRGRRSLYSRRSECC